MGNLYLFHIQPPHFHARHYLGFTERDDLLVRIREHEAGQGSHLTRAALAAGHELLLVAVAAADRRQERQIKRISRLWQWCPICAREAGVKLRLLGEKIPAPNRPVKGRSQSA